MLSHVRNAQDIWTTVTGEMKMMNCDCPCITEINGKYYTDCEVYGKCWTEDKVYNLPDEQLDEFKEKSDSE